MWQLFNKNRQSTHKIHICKCGKEHTPYEGVILPLTFYFNHYIIDWYFRSLESSASCNMSQRSQKIFVASFSLAFIMQCICLPWCKSFHFEHQWLFTILCQCHGFHWNITNQVLFAINELQCFVIEIILSWEVYIF